METLFGLDTDLISRYLLVSTIILTVLVVLLSLRNKILLKISLRNIPRRKAQSVLIIFGLMLSSTIIMSALAIGDSVSWSIKNTVMGGLGEVDIAIVDSDVENGFISDDELNVITENVKNNQNLDGVIPAVRYTSPIMGEKSEKTVSNSEIVGFDVNNTYGFFSRQSLKSINGSFLEEDDLDIQDNETIINRYLSDAIDANIGDNILLIKPGDKKILRVVNIVESKGLAGGGEESPASALMNYNVVKEFTGVEGYNYVGVSLEGGLEIDRELSKEISSDLQLLFISDEITNEIFFALKSPNVFEALKLQIETLSNDTEEINRRLAEALKGDKPDNDQDSSQDDSEPDLTIDAVMTWSARELLQEMDFEKMSSEELSLAKRAIKKFKLPIMEVPTRRFKRDSRGDRIDMRATLRSSLRSGGSTISLNYRKRIRRHPPLVVLCDISGSMSRYSRMILHFMHAITNDRDRVNTFLFGTRLTNVTRYLRYKDVDDALDRVTGAVDDWSGGTRIGNSLREFNLKWSRRSLSQGAVVLLITDGLDRDAAEGLEDEVVRLHKSCRRLIWLNPLLRYDRYEPKSLGARALLPNVDDFRSVHNLESLDQLTRALSNESIDRSNIQRLLEATE